MTVTIELPEDIEAKLHAEALARGVPLPQFVRDFLIDHYEEVEDLRIAESRLDEPQAPITATQLRNNLGLDN